MKKATKLQIKQINKIAKLLGIKKINTKGLTSKEASNLYKNLIYEFVNKGAVRND